MCLFNRFASATKESLEAVALSGGVYGYTQEKPPRDQLQPRFGYALHAVPEGNRWKILLMPVTGGARRTWQRGKLNWMATFSAMKIVELEAYCRVIVQYQFEPRVVRVTTRLVAAAKVCGHKSLSARPWDDLKITLEWELLDEKRQAACVELANHVLEAVC